MSALPREATKTAAISYVGDVPNSDTVSKVPGPFLPSVFVVRVYGGTVPCIEGRSEMEGIQFASRGRPAGGAPNPRFGARSRGAAISRGAPAGGPRIPGRGGGGLKKIASASG